MTMPLDTPVLRADPTPVSGMLLAAFAFALLSSVDTIFKLVAAGHPSHQILLINGLFAIMPIVGWALLTGGFERLHTERPLLHIIRGSISVASGFSAIYAYSRLPLADFYAIVFSGPLIVTALSVFWLGEKIDRKRWLAIFIGFLGVLVITQPFADGHNNVAAKSAGRVAALVSVTGYALSIIMLRRMRQGESNLTFSLYGYIAATAIGGGLFILWGGPEMHAVDFAHLALSGFLAGTSSICLMTAYHRSPVARVAPFQYTQIFWGALAGWLIWQEVPGKELLFGAIVVAASGLYVIYSEICAPREQAQPKN